MCFILLSLLNPENPLQGSSFTGEILQEHCGAAFYFFSKYLISVTVAIFILRVWLQHYCVFVYIQSSTCDTQVYNGL